MTLLLTIFSFIIYCIIGTIVKVYYKLYRWDRLLKEETVFVGLFWPIYIVYRVIWGVIKFLSWPLVKFSNFIENKFKETKREKSKEKNQKVRVDCYDHELEDAKQEVEAILSCTEEKFNRL